MKMVYYFQVIALIKPHFFLARDYTFVQY